MVVLLVVVAIVLIMVSRGGNVFTDFGGEKIETGGDVSECEILCWECCHDPDEPDCSNPQDPELQQCNCNDYRPTTFGC